MEDGLNERLPKCHFSSFHPTSSQTKSNLFTTTLKLLPKFTKQYQHINGGTGWGAVRKKNSEKVFFSIIFNLRFLQEPSSGAEIRLHTKNLLYI